jgi:type VI secretion system protein ImpK
MMRIVNKQDKGREKKHVDVSYRMDENIAAAKNAAMRAVGAQNSVTPSSGILSMAAQKAAYNQQSRVVPDVIEHVESQVTAVHIPVTHHPADPVEPEMNEQDYRVQKMTETNLALQQFDEPGIALQSSVTPIAHPNPTTQLLLSSKVIIHRPEAGLNPMVDAAAHLFSVMGRLKHLKTHQHLDKLHAELMQDIEDFSETIQAYNYNQDYIPEYLLITRYALCVTLDDIILSTPWGGQGKWDKYGLVASFEQEPLSHQSFLIILERLVRDPDIYIDLMEFMYICLSLGFKCHYNSSQFDHEQLEHISNALYKRIRAYRGNFSKILSPFSVRPSAASSASSPLKKVPGWSIILFAGVISIALIAGGKILLDRSFKHVNQSLTQTELVPYAKNNQSVK